MEQQLTPFEQANAARHRAALFGATISAAHDLVQIAVEAQIQIDAFKSLLKTGDAPTQIERDLTVEAMKDIRLGDKALALLAQTLEDEFGICA